MPPHLHWQRSNVTFSKNETWKVYKHRTQNLQWHAIPSRQWCAHPTRHGASALFLQAHMQGWCWGHFLSLYKIKIKTEKPRRGNNLGPTSPLGKVKQKYFKLILVK